MICLQPCTSNSGFNAQIEKVRSNGHLPSDNNSVCIEFQTTYKIRFYQWSQWQFRFASFPLIKFHRRRQGGIEAWPQWRLYFNALVHVQPPRRNEIDFFYIKSPSADERNWKLTFLYQICESVTPSKKNPREATAWP